MNLQRDDQVWVIDDYGSVAWPGRIVAVTGDSAEIFYGGDYEIFSLPDGRRGNRWLVAGPVPCRHCSQVLVPSPPGNPQPGQWEDPDGFTQCMKYTGPLPVLPGGRVMHTPMPRIPEMQAGQ
jgi:hypothetical protein